MGAFLWCVKTLQPMHAMFPFALLIDTGMEACKYENCVKAQYFRTNCVCEIGHEVSAQASSTAESFIAGA